MKNYVIYLLLVVWPVFVVSQTLPSDYDRSSANVTKIDDRYLIASDTFGEENKGSVEIHYIPEDETLLMRTFIPKDYFSFREQEAFNNMTIVESYETLVGHAPYAVVAADSIIAAKRVELEESVWFPGSAPFLPLASGEEDPCDDTPEDPEWPVPLEPCPEPEPTEPDPTEPDPEPGTGKPPQPSDPVPPSGKPIIPRCQTSSNDWALDRFDSYFCNNFDGDFFMEDWANLSNIFATVDQGKIKLQIYYKKSGEWKLHDSKQYVDADSGSVSIKYTTTFKKKLRVGAQEAMEMSSYDFNSTWTKTSANDYPEDDEMLELLYHCNKVTINGILHDCIQ